MRFIDKAVWLEKEKILVLADLHLGFEESLIEQGILLPRTQYKKIVRDLKNIFKEVKKSNIEVKEVVILGDLKHEFGSVSKQEWKETLNLLNFLSKKIEKGKIVLVKGNHDTILEPIAKKKGLEVKDFYIKDNLAFLHGHKFFPEILDKKIKKIFLGHIHPAISIRECVKSEIYKCFLVGKWKGKEVVILPSFFPLIEGVDVLIEGTNLASELKLKLKNFEVYVPVSVDEVLDFGKVGANKLARLI